MKMITMRRKYLALAFSACLLASAPARADWTGKNAAGQTITFKNLSDCTNVVCVPVAQPVDAIGNPLAGVAGTTNPNGTALFMQGVTNGVPLSVFFATPQHVICDSGCAGGGGGGNVNLTEILGAAPSATNPLWMAPANGATFPISGSVGITGTLPGFATTPTVNIGTAPTIAVTGAFFQATQPISAASLPLPAGAATQTTLASILSALNTPFQAGGSIGNTGFNALQGGAANSLTNAFFVSPASSAVFPISASSLPLPAAASTSALQSTGNASLAAIATAVNQGTANSLANAWPWKITDGANGPVAVKGANTPPVTTDPALVMGSADGNLVTVGTKADAPCPIPASTTACSLIAGVKALANAASGSIPAGNNTIGAVAQIGTANFVATQVSVGSTATQIVAARTGGSGTGRKTVCITQTGTLPVYIGGSGVTTSTGDFLPGGSGSGKCWDTQAAIFGIVASGSQTVSATETF